MSAIVDTLNLDFADIEIIKNRYPGCVITKQTDNKSTMQNFQVVITNENEEDYNHFLIDNCIAISSTNFINRALDDPTFVGKINERIATRPQFDKNIKHNYQKED